MEVTREFLSNTLDAIVEANRKVFSPPEEGYSGGAIGSLLGSLIEMGPENSAYAEIGVFRGGTLFQVAGRNKGRCFGIDNFSLFDEGIENEDFLKRKIVEDGYQNVKLLSMDFESALHDWASLSGGAEISVLFVDGPHDYRSQLMALILAEPHMAPAGVIAIDDANYRHVRQATWDFLSTHPDWSLLAEITTEGHPAVQNDAETVDRLRRGWSNGLHILVRDPMSLVKFVNKEPADLAPFYMSHDVFRHRYAPIAKQVLDSLDSPNGNGATQSFDQTARLLEAFLGENPHRTPPQNTETGGEFSFSLARLEPLQT